jgi:hypothetical protein
VSSISCTCFKDKSTIAIPLNRKAFAPKTAKLSLQTKLRGLRLERVRCPVGGCECGYEMYGLQTSSRDRDITTLQERLKREHPGHTSEVLAVNAFRRVPR